MSGLADRLTTAVLLLLIGGYLWQASRYNADARLIPFIVGGGAFAVALVQLLAPLVRAALRPDADAETPALPAHAGEPDAEPVDGRRLAAIVTWTVLLAAAIYLFGFVVAVPVFAFLLFVVVERRVTLTALGICAALTMLSWVFTSHLLARAWNDAFVWKYLARAGWF